jgi:cell division protein ZapB
LDTHAVARLRGNYIRRAPRDERAIRPGDNVIKHFQKRPLFLDASMDLKDSAAVEAEFSALEAKVSQFVNVCERLRAENSDLRQQLAAAQNDAKRLNDKIDGARSKLETLISRLPD